MRCCLALHWAISAGVTADAELVRTGACSSHIQQEHQYRGGEIVFMNFQSIVIEYCMLK